MTELARWIKANKIKAVRLQTDTDDNTFTTRPMSVAVEGATIFVNGHEWFAADSATESITSTGTIFVIETPTSSITIHKA